MFYIIGCRILRNKHAFVFMVLTLDSGLWPVGRVRPNEVSLPPACPGAPLGAIPGARVNAKAFPGQDP